ncbi:hypothetical protein HK102_004228 [Quaeritorhiza haematococci]|nr:hypothetical protein HK102_004228 [Quaeritorhiza haematococci]
MVSKTLMLAGAAWMASVWTGVYAAEYTVTVGPGLKYTPDNITINVGDSVKWVSEGGTHTVTQVEKSGQCNPKSGGFVSEQLSQGKTFSSTFSEVGCFWYVCTVGQHCQNGMRGVVVVQQSGAPPPPAPPSPPAAQQKEGAYGSSTPSYPESKPSGGAYGNDAAAPAQNKNSQYGPPPSQAYGSSSPAYGTAVPTPAGGVYGTPGATPPSPAGGAAPAPASAPVTAPADAPKVTIKVGEGGLKFEPAELTVPPGTWIEWDFVAGNHNVKQVSNATSCEPIPNGFASQNFGPGNKFVQQMPSTAQRVWFVCTVGQHCQQGMRGLIIVDPNAPALPSTSGSAASTPQTANNVTGTAAAQTAGGSGKVVTVMVGPGGLVFEPKDVTIQVGDTVQWKLASGTHNVVQVDSASTCEPKTGGFASATLSANAAQDFSRTFTEVGTINYVCTPHCAKGMRGTISVAAASSGSKLHARMGQVAAAMGAVAVGMAVVLV